MAQIHTLPPNTYTTRPDQTFYGVPASGAGWFRSGGHIYKTNSKTSDNNKLVGTDNTVYDSRYDNDFKSGTSPYAGGNPCTSTGFEVSFWTNTNTPGYLVAVAASGSRNNLAAWKSTSIGRSDQSNCMKNIVGCTFKSDSSGSNSDNSPYIYVHKVGFIYKNLYGGRTEVFYLNNSLSGVEHWNTSHYRNSIYQGGYVDYNRIHDGLSFHGMIVEYWSKKNTGTTARKFNHKIKNLNFIIKNGTFTPSTSDRRYNPCILEAGSNTHGSDNVKIWTS